MTAEVMAMERMMRSMESCMEINRTVSVIIRCGNDDYRSKYAEVNTRQRLSGLTDQGLLVSWLNRV